MFIFFASASVPVLVFPTKTLHPGPLITSWWYSHPLHNLRSSFDINQLKSSVQMLAYEAPVGFLVDLPHDGLQMSLGHI